MKNIVALAKVVRSKNTGPFDLTLDIIFKHPDDYFRVKEKQMINEKVVAELYKLPLEKIQKVIYFDPANAVKIVMAREIPSGSPGDSDVYGAQQHAPLLKLNLDLD